MVAAWDCGALEPTLLLTPRGNSKAENVLHFRVPKATGHALRYIGINHEIFRTRTRRRMTRELTNLKGLLMLYKGGLLGHAIFCRSRE